MSWRCVKALTRSSLIRARKEGLHAVTRVVVEVGVDDALP